jgi:hypothetical protein
VGAGLTQASGLAKREAALMLVEGVPRRHRITVGARPGLRHGGLRRRPAPAQRHAARSAERLRPELADRPPDDAPPRVSGEPGARKRIEEAFAWIKTIAGQAKTNFRGTARVGWAFILAAAAYNLIRLPKLLGAAP